MPPDRPTLRRVLVEAALVALGNLLGVLAYGGYRAEHLHRPLSYEGDALAYQAIIKAIVDTGWYFDIARLGAPFALDHRDFPVPDIGALLAIKVLGWFTSDPAAIFNLLFIASFFLVPFTAYVAARRLDIPGPACAVLASAFNLLPFHYHRLGHLFYTLYFSVPIYAYVALRLLSGAHSGGNRRQLALRAAAVAAASTFGLYNAVFGLALLTFAALYLWVGNRRAAIEGLAMGAVIVATLLACLSPNILHRVTHGTNVEAAKRPAVDGEVYALRATLLVIPPPEHRLPALARAGEAFTAQAPLLNENRTGWLGVLGVAGFALTLIAGLGLFLRGPSMRTVRAASRANLFLFLFGTMGGLGAIFNYLVWPQIRAHNRISVFIAFLSLVILAWVVFRSESAARRASTRLAWVAAVALCLAAAFDLVTAPGTFERLAETYRPRYESDREFAQGLERALPAGAMVFQLPHQRFPEAPPVHRVGSYDGFQPYLHTRALRFSFGAMRSRPEADWQDELAQLRPAALARQLEEHGFAAILVDRNGYADGGTAIREALAARGHSILRENENYIAFRLNPKSPPRLPVVRPYAWRTAGAFHGIERWTDGVGAWCRDDCVVAFERTRSAWRKETGQPAVVELSLQAYGERNVTITVEGRETRVLRPGVSNAVVKLTVPPDVERFDARFKTDSAPLRPGTGDHRLLAFRVFDIRMD